MPLIAVTTDRRARGPAPESLNLRPARPEIFVGEHVLDRLRAVGLDAVLLPPGSSPEVVARVLEWVDGVVITGGAFDIHPRHYGQGVAGRLDRVDDGRTALELALAGACLQRGLPVLGLCGGLQVLAVAAGGTLVQDIGAQLPGALRHEQPTDPATTWHGVDLAPGLLRELYGGPQIQVNSTHHQALDHPGFLEILARSPDGVIEAAGDPRRPFALGVQWHPELLDDNAIFLGFARATCAG